MKILFLILFLFFTQIQAQSLKDKSAQRVRSFFADSTHLIFNKIKIPAKIKRMVESRAQQKFYRDQLYCWKVVNKDSVLAYAFLDNVNGKSLPITFLVILDSSGAVINTQIIKYREPYGGAVSSAHWQNQFKGKNSTSKFKVGHQIDAISGATISVHALAKGVKKIVLLYPLLKSLKQL